MGRPSARGHAPRSSHLQDVNRWRAWADARKDEAVRLAQGQLDACHQCRECSGQVNLTERICPSCGVADPARVPMALSTAIGVTVVMALYVLVWVL